ncbi:MAG: periplasmic heavy metal sensor [Alphaproteobacteria bacterium]|nr:hypothetical protein [Hyphomonas sp.]MBR9806526.1 periplasmic heavy metal sensor [Alphaproteobacteria bacterium]|tara:strand:- start:542 stop:1003 length:462 start_codon:yes stop_codon:yes gene_type:complete
MTEPVSSPRRIPFWLTISLLANMMLLGLVGGMVLQNRGPGDEPPPGPPGKEKPLSEEDRKAFYTLLRESYRSTKPERDVRDEVRSQLADVLTRQPFDRPAVEEAFRKLRASDERVHAVAHEAMIDRLEAMGPGKRAMMAERLARGPERRRHKD